ncbi:hypothetical protein AJ87_41695 [Rhizobium yanglingense]|nr:hypothetical protein AJ87_41695 [Rhizobium yanglingense]
MPVRILILPRRGNLAFVPFGWIVARLADYRPNEIVPTLDKVPAVLAAAGGCNARRHAWLTN